MHVETASAKDLVGVVDGAISWLELETALGVYLARGMLLS